MVRNCLAQGSLGFFSFRLLFPPPFQQQTPAKHHQSELPDCPLIWLLQKEDFFFVLLVLFAVVHVRLYSARFAWLNGKITDDTKGYVDLLLFCLILSLHSSPAVPPSESEVGLRMSHVKTQRIASQGGRYIFSIDITLHVIRTHQFNVLLFRLNLRENVLYAIPNRQPCSSVYWAFCAKRNERVWRCCCVLDWTICSFIFFPFLWVWWPSVESERFPHIGAIISTAPERRVGWFFVFFNPSVSIALMRPLFPLVVKR